MKDYEPILNEFQSEYKQIADEVVNDWFNGKDNGVYDSILTDKHFNIIQCFISLRNLNAALLKYTRKKSKNEQPPIPS